jgi:hypothetical protein
LKFKRSTFALSASIINRLQHFSFFQIIFMISSGVHPPTHEHLGPAIDWDGFLNIGWEQRLDEAKWLKPKVSEATM